MGVLQSLGEAGHNPDRGADVAAALQHVEVLESELVGMAPAEALVDVARQALHFGRLDANAILETRLLEHALDVLGGP